MQLHSSRGWQTLEAIFETAGEQVTSKRILKRRRESGSWPSASLSATGPVRSNPFSTFPFSPPLSFSPTSPLSSPISAAAASHSSSSSSCPASQGNNFRGPGEPLAKKLAACRLNERRPFAVAVAVAAPLSGGGDDDSIASSGPSSAPASSTSTSASRSQAQAQTGTALS